jgi:hypothetical protein
LPKHPDRSYLADAIHFMDLIDLADEELPAARATVEQAKAAAVTARKELDEHQQWLGQHQELYTEAVSGEDIRLEYHEDSYPKLPSYLDRRPVPEWRELREMRYG